MSDIKTGEEGIRPEWKQEVEQLQNQEVKNRESDHKVQNPARWFFSQIKSLARQTSQKLLGRAKINTISKEKEPLLRGNAVIRELIATEDTFIKGIEIMRDEVLPNLERDLPEKMEKVHQKVQQELKTPSRKKSLEKEIRGCKDKELKNFVNEIKNSIDDLYSEYKTINAAPKSAGIRYRSFDSKTYRETLEEKISGIQSKMRTLEMFKKGKGEERLYHKLSSYLSPMARLSGGFSGQKAIQELRNRLKGEGFDNLKNFNAKLHEISEIDVSKIKRKSLETATGKVLEEEKEAINQGKEGLSKAENTLSQLYREEFPKYAEAMNTNGAMARKIIDCMKHLNIEARAEKKDAETEADVKKRSDIGQPAVIIQRMPRHELLLRELEKHLKSLGIENSKTFDFVRQKTIEFNKAV